MEAVIMTGGKGMRMSPYTKVLPKGLLPVGEKPILEIIVKQLRYHGFTNITMACGYLAPLIQAYFGDGKAWNVSITYQVEHEPYGTAGPLKTLTHLSEPFLLINCDVLTTLSFRQLWEFHRSGDSLMTIASQKKQIPIELGVLETEGDRVTGFVEKPSQTAHVSMGIYVLNPEILHYIPEKRFFDIPDLIQALLAAGKVVRHYDNDAFWFDIGRPTDFERANEAYPKMKHLLLPGECE